MAAPTETADAKTADAKAGVDESSSEINYSFILGMYVFFLALGVLFGLMEFVGKIDAVAGFYLIFAPFVPATFWCVFARRRWLKTKLIAE